jgi:redox-sensitive bicupin YhaK (pirin superfamily)
MSTTLESIVVRKSEDRGYADHGWLKSRHTFSFAGYYNPEFMEFRSLRVINQDRVEPGQGFGEHPHRDMEIFSYVLEGSLRHLDSMGNGRELKPGQVQLMSAGRGVTHSEYNPSIDEGLHFLQIWIQPMEKALSPSYTEWHPSKDTENSTKTLIISKDGREESALIHQDADVYRILLQPGESIHHKLDEGRGAWLQVIRGDVALNDVDLNPGDAGSTEIAGTLNIRAKETPVEALLFDLK